MSGSRKLVVGLSLLLAVTCSVAAYCFASATILRLKIAFAEDQTAFFEEMRSRAEAGDAATALDCLESVVNYYPSGTKQSQGSRLDDLVERARRNAVREIIARLRMSTGKDYGDNPHKWLGAMRERNISD